MSNLTTPHENTEKQDKNPAGQIRNLLADGDHDQALILASELVRAKPENAEAHCLLGQVHASQGKHGGAVDDFNRAIEVKPYIGEYYSLRAEARVGLGDYEGAVNDLSVAVESSGIDYESLRRRAEILLSMGRVSEALTDLQKLTEMMGEDYYVPNDGLLQDWGDEYLERGVDSLRKGNFEDALAWLRASEAVHLWDINTDLLRALANHGLDRIDEAETQLCREVSRRHGSHVKGVCVFVFSIGDTQPKERNNEQAFGQSHLAAVYPRTDEGNCEATKRMTKLVANEDSRREVVGENSDVELVGVFDCDGDAVNQIALTFCRTT